MDNIAKWITKFEVNGAEVIRQNGLYIISHNGNIYKYDPKSNSVTVDNNVIGTLKYLIKTIIN